MITGIMSGCLQVNYYPLDTATSPEECISYNSLNGNHCSYQKPHLPLMVWNDWNVDQISLVVKP